MYVRFVASPPIKWLFGALHIKKYKRKRGTKMFPSFLALKGVSEWTRAR